MKQLSRLDVNKGFEHDGLHSRVLRLLTHLVVQSLCGIVNRSSSLSIVPSDWPLAISSIIFKKGETGSAPPT